MLQLTRLGVILVSIILPMIQNRIHPAHQLRILNGVCVLVQQLCHILALSQQIQILPCCLFHASDKL